MKKNQITRIVGISVLIFIGIAAYLISRQIDLFSNTNLNDLETFISSHGILSPLIYILLMAIAIVISPIPSLPLTVASGVVFGPFLGASYSLIGAEIGAVISFLIARIFGRDLIKKLLKKEISFSNNIEEKYLTLAIFLSRLFPIFQFDVVSYGAGLTNIAIRKFALATFFGMMPMTFLFAYTGKSIFIGGRASIIISIIFIAAIFYVPILIKKYDLIKHIKPEQ